ncbi:hypothetical protein H312_01375, partial [Anncaliia algerae PRA339]
HDSNASVQPIKMALKMDSHPKELARMEKRKSLKSSDDDDSSEEDSDTNFYETKDKSDKVDFRAVYDRMLNNYIRYVTKANNNSKNKMFLKKLRKKVEKHIHQLHAEFHGADVYLKNGQWDEKMHKDFSQMLLKFTDFTNVLNMLIGEEQDESESNEEEDTSKEGYSSSQVKGVKRFKKSSDSSSEEDSDTDFYSLRDISGKVDFEAICNKMKENCFNYIGKAQANTGNLVVLDKIYRKVEKHIRFISSELKGYGIYLGTGQMNEELFNEFDELYKKFKELENILHEILCETSESSESEVNNDNSDEEEDSFKAMKELNSDINFDSLTDKSGNLNYKKVLRKMKKNYDNYKEEGDNNLNDSDALLTVIKKVKDNISVLNFFSEREESIDDELSTKFEDLHKKFNSLKDVLKSKREKILKESDLNESLITSESDGKKSTDSLNYYSALYKNLFNNYVKYIDEASNSLDNSNALLLEIIDKIRRNYKIINLILKKRKLMNDKTYNKFKNLYDNLLALERIINDVLNELPQEENKSLSTNPIGDDVNFTPLESLPAEYYCKAIYELMKENYKNYYAESKKLSNEIELIRDLIGIIELNISSSSTFAEECKSDNKKYHKKFTKLNKKFRKLLKILNDMIIIPQENDEDLVSHENNEDSLPHENKESDILEKGEGSEKSFHEDSFPHGNKDSDILEKDEGSEKSFHEDSFPHENKESDITVNKGEGSEKSFHEDSLPHENKDSDITVNKGEGSEVSDDSDSVKSFGKSDEAKKLNKKVQDLEQSTSLLTKTLQELKEKLTKEEMNKRKYEELEEELRNSRKHLREVEEQSEYNKSEIQKLKSINKSLEEKVKPLLENISEKSEEKKEVSPKKPSDQKESSGFDSKEDIKEYYPEDFQSNKKGEPEKSFFISSEDESQSKTKESKDSNSSDDNSMTHIYYPNKNKPLTSEKDKDSDDQSAFESGGESFKDITNTPEKVRNISKEDKDLPKTPSVTPEPFSEEKPTDKLIPDSEEEILVDDVFSSDEDEISKKGGSTEVEPEANPVKTKEDVETSEDKKESSEKKVEPEANPVKTPIDDLVTPDEDSNEEHSDIKSVKSTTEDVKTSEERKESSEKKVEPEANPVKSATEDMISSDEDELSRKKESSEKKVEPEVKPIKPKEDVEISDEDSNEEHSDTKSVKSTTEDVKTSEEKKESSDKKVEPEADPVKTKEDVIFSEDDEKSKKEDSDEEHSDTKSVKSTTEDVEISEEKNESSEKKVEPEADPVKTKKDDVEISDEDELSRKEESSDVEPEVKPVK